MDKRQEELFNEFVNILFNFDNKEKLKNFLLEILTAKEIEDLANRWLILKELGNGKSQRQLAKEAHLSLCKITRGAKILKKQDSISKEIISQLNNKRIQDV